MKRRISTWLVAIVATLTLPETVAAQIARFNVATYNIRQKNHIDSVRGNGWGYRLPHLTSLIRFHGFDIFGTQEGFKTQLDDMLAQLPGYAYIGVGRDDGKQKGEHAAIFYRTELFEIVDSGNFWLSETPKHPSKGWDAALPRVCSWAHFRHIASGKEFIFFNLHMDHKGVQARIESGKLVKQMTDSLGKGLPAFLTGDFNVDQTHQSYFTITSDGKFVDSYEAAGFRYAPNGTFNNYHADRYDDSRIDHIFTTPNVTVEKYGILTDTYRSLQADSVQARVPSDHFPVVVTVVLP
ncbi:MAG: endonuclease/exonuclease/phosphatase family protein [Muribaculum sp.]|nr:endonuclease/exonuclease/phosphatase family protein [Muribaculaceae bacterium]MCM1081227.1 endonuclease/exonuclease/phosphatase family protein [Muribaculum sp.]